MDKKGIIGIIAAVAGLIAWQVYYGKQMKEYEAQRVAYEAEQAKKAEAEQATQTPGATPSAVSPIAVAPKAPTAPVPEKLEKIRTRAAEYAFTNVGGGIARAVLFDHIVDKKQKGNVVLNEFGTIPIGAISDAAGAKTDIPFTVRRDDASKSVTFEHVDDKQLVLTKKFSLPNYESLKGGDRLREEYLVWLDVTFANRGTEPVVVPNYWLHTGSAAPIHPKDAPLFIGFNYFQGSGNEFVDLGWFRGGGIWPFKSAPRAVYPETPEVMSDVRWASVSNQYFSTLLVPHVDEKASSDVQKAQRGVGVWARRHDITSEAWQLARSSAPEVEVYGIDGAIQMSGFTLAPGQSETRRFQVLAGPSEYRRLRQFGNYETEILDFGMFGLISKGLLNSLNGLKSFLGSYWAAIMVLTIIIRSAMWPLQNRATETAKKMQKLSPLLKDLQERYKEDPMRLQQETGKLWKQHGINPLGGCLPMLVQIPIFFGFYNMLNRAVELRNNGFLWVEDLSQPDTVMHIAGIPLNPLPLVMAGTMLLQMKLTPKAGDPMQQKIMMFMPLIFIAICYNYAAALALYWSVQNLFSIVQLYVTRDKQPASVEVIPPPKPTKPRR